MYQIQQSHEQRSKSKGMGEDTDALNYMSIGTTHHTKHPTIQLVEYQSLENSVRSYHVKALQEMREFWQGVRNKKPVAQIAYDLDKLSNLALRTQETYTTLLERFPNSKNMLNLQARYIAIVGSDRETAATFSEAADIHEENIEGDDIDPNGNAREVGKITAGPAAPSVGSSTTTVFHRKQRIYLLIEI
jgi:hypothetical protein